MFSRLEVDNEKTREHGRIACCLIDFLVSSVQLAKESERADPDSCRLLDEFLADVMNCIQEVIDATSPHDCMFSPTRLSNTACQLYFVFIGM